MFVCLQCEIQKLIQIPLLRTWHGVRQSLSHLTLPQANQES